MDLKLEVEQLMMRYLMGELSEEERDLVEEKFFTDESFYQNLLLAEDDLLYDYQRGALSKDQHRKVEARVAASPGLRRKLKSIESLMTLDSAALQVETSTDGEMSRRGIYLWQTISDFLTIRRLAPALALAAVMLIAFGSYYLVTKTERLNSEIARLEIEKEKERLASLEKEQEMRRQIEDENEKAANLASEIERERRMRQEAEDEARRLRSQQQVATASFILMPGLVRDRDEPERLVIPREMRKAELKLDLEGEEKYRSFRVELRTMGGNLLWSQAVRSASESASGKAVAITLPASILINGEYEITLKGSSGEGPLEVFRYYYFLVMRR